MFDIQLRSLKDGLFNPLCQFVPSSISPGLITLLAFLSGLLSVYLASQRYIFPSLLLWSFNRSLDCLDGALARHRNVASDLGGFLDLLADFWIYSLLPIGIAVGWDFSPSCLLSVALLETTFHINNFILFYVAAIAEKKANDEPSKTRTKELTSVMMRPAFIEGMESGVLFTLMLAFPKYISLWCGLMSAAVGELENDPEVRLGLPRRFDRTPLPSEKTQASMPLPSQYTLLVSTLAYPVLLRLLCGPSPSPPHFSASIKHISTLHSSLLTTLSLYILKDAPWRRHQENSLDPLITTRSDFANAITAIEAGYLLQDSVALVREARLYNAGGGEGISRHLDKTLLVHHVGIGLALLRLHQYIAQGREKGIYIIVMFLLMNASTPLLNLRWYLRTFAKHRRKIILAADVAFVAAFFLARVYLVWRILGEYGRYHEWDPLETFWKGLRVPCQMGTGALVVANLGWWVVMCQNLARGGRRFTFGGQ